MNNWIKISRCILKMNGYFGERFPKPLCFIDLLLLASYKQRQMKMKCGVLTLQRGEIAISLPNLAKRWSVTVRHCRTILKTLAKEERITLRSELQVTIIKVINYDLYQSAEESDTVNGKVSDTVGDTVSDTVTDQANSNVSATYNADNSKSDTVTDTVTDTVSDTVSDTQLKKVYKKESIITKENIINKLIISKKGGTPFPSAEIIEFWNAEMDKAKAIVPRMKTMTDLRKRMAAARLREYDAEDFVTVIENCAKSNFLNGHNDRGWTPDFTWAMGPDHFAKILEGRYDNVTTNAVNTTAKFNVNDLWK